MLKDKIFHGYAPTSWNRTNHHGEPGHFAPRRTNERSGRTGRHRHDKAIRGCSSR